ncbi:MAG: penicillin-binding transpeptidase domain-containing protein [Geminicoccaceae bacterium]
MRLPEFRIGKNGIEKRARPSARLAGRSRIEVNAIGREIRELDRDDGISGADLQLSLDAELQLFCYERLSSELSASAVVVDVDTGAVLALARCRATTPPPSPVACRTSNGRNGATTRAPPCQQIHPRAVPARLHLQDDGGAGGAEAGLVTPSYDVFCGGSVSLGNAKFHCWKSHGRVAMHEAIAQSCDVYFYDLARRVGVDGIAAMAKRFGLGAPLGLDLPGEQPGLVPTSQWKRETLGEPWQKGETLVIGIGQGYMLATPLQLAIMTARLCNGGRAVTPWFYRDPAAEPPAVGSVGVSQASSIMCSRACPWWSTAMWHVSSATPDTRGVQMAGKSGTRRCGGSPGRSAWPICTSARTGPGSIATTPLRRLRADRPPAAPGGLGDRRARPERQQWRPRSSGTS